MAYSRIASTTPLPAESFPQERTRSLEKPPLTASAASAYAAWAHGDGLSNKGS